MLKSKKCHLQIFEIFCKRLISIISRLKNKLIDKTKNGEFLKSRNSRGKKAAAGKKALEIGKTAFEILILKLCKVALEIGVAKLKKSG